MIDAWAGGFAWSLMRWGHLLAAAVWTGGLVTLAVLVVSLRRAGASREQLRAAARAFGRLSWAALGVSVALGLVQVWLLGTSWQYRPLQWKVGLVGLTAALALVHQLTARNSSPAVRGVLQLGIVVCSVAIFWAAVHLHLS